jgi:hypothetical protein
MILLPGEFVLIVMAIMKVEGTLCFFSNHILDVVITSQEMWLMVSGARYFDSSKSYSSHEVCILNFSLRLLEEYSSLWSMVSASLPYL